MKKEEENLKMDFTLSGDNPRKNCGNDNYKKNQVSDVNFFQDGTLTIHTCVDIPNC